MSKHQQKVAFQNLEVIITTRKKQHGVLTQDTKQKRPRNVKSPWRKSRTDSFIHSGI